MDPQCASVESCHVPGAFNVHAMMLPFGAKGKDVSHIVVVFPSIVEMTLDYTITSLL